MHFLFLLNLNAINGLTLDRVVQKGGSYTVFHVNIGGIRVFSAPSMMFVLNVPKIKENSCSASEFTIIGL